MDSMPAHRTSGKIRLVAFGIGIIVAAAVFGIALVISDDLRLLYLSGALLFAFCRIFAGHQGARRFDRRCSASFRIGVLVRVLCPVANTFSLADASVVDGDCRVAAIPEAIRQNYHNCWGCDLNGGLSLVLRVLHSGADAARVNARGQWRGAAIHFATNQPESGADSLYTRQNSCARFFRHLVFSMYCRAAGTGACSCRSSD